MLNFSTNAGAECAGAAPSSAVTVNNETATIPGSRQLVSGSGTLIDTTSPGQIKVNLPNSGVTAGSYAATNITVNAQGIITSATNGSGGGSSTPITVGPWASRPTTSSGAAAIYVCNDAPTTVYDTGTALSFQTMGYSVVPPLSTNFTTIRAGAGTINYGNAELYVRNTSNSSGADTLIGTPITHSGNVYTVTGAFRLVLDGNNPYPHAGLMIRDSTSGNFICFSWERRTSQAPPYIEVCEFNSSGVAGSDLYVSSNAWTDSPMIESPNGLAWMRITSDGTTESFQLSKDGSNWITVFSQSATTYITPDQWGVHVCNYQGTPAALVEMHAYHLTEDL